MECFLITSHKVNHSLYVPPLDDTYIYYQYAKQIARGRLFRYQDGEAVSTGSTSTLYPFLLAPAWKLGLRGPALFWGGFYVNVIALLFSMGLIYASLRRLLPGDPWMPPLGALLVAGNGWFLWGIASGMDTGVLAACLSFTMYGLVLYALDEKVRVLAVALALLGVSRPEGLALAWVTVGVLTLQRRFGPGSRGLPSASSRLEAVRGWLRAWLEPRHLPPWRIGLGLVVGTLPTLALAVASGHLSTNGMVLKSHATHLLGWLRYFDAVSRTLTAIPERLIWVPSAWLRGPMLIAMLLGIGGLSAAITLRGRWQARTPGWVAGLWCVTIVLFYGFLLGTTEQHNRYYMAYWPLVVLLVVGGLHTASLAFPAAAQASLRRTAVLALILLGMSSVPHWARDFAFNCKDLAEQHVEMSKWIDENLDPDAVLAINDAGAMAYLSRRRVVDIFGLVSNDFRAPGYWRAEGYIWEGLERRRPSHLVIYPGWFDDLQRLFCLRRIHTVDIRRDSLLGDHDKVAFEIQWNLVAPPGVPRSLPEDRKTWKLHDVLDVADAVSEREHHYRVRQGEMVAGAMFKLHTFSVGEQRTIDGGRCYSGSERFRARGLRPGAALLLGVRSDFAQDAPLEVEIGSWRQGWRPATRDTQKATEAYLQVPSEAIAESSPEIRIRCLDKNKGFSSFHWFMLQPPQ